MINEKLLNKVFLLRNRFIKRYYNRVFYPYQEQPSNEIIKAALHMSGDEFYVELSRQSGKTEMIVLTVVFLLIFAKDLFEMTGIELETSGWYIVIGAPQKEQAKTDFDRIKDYLKVPCKDLGIGFDEANGTTLKLTNGNISYCFPISPTANIESKTAHLLLFEECQDIPDADKNKKVVPMGTATNAPSVHIGTAGYQLCDFYRGLNSGRTGVYIFDCWEVIKQRREAHERDGKQWHLRYEEYVRKQIIIKGEFNPEVRTQYFLEWQLTKGMWITQENFDKIVDYKLDLVREDLESECLVGMDVAKASDVTFVTVWKKDGFKDVVRRVPSTREVKEDEPEKPRMDYDTRMGVPPPKKKEYESYYEETTSRQPVYRLLNWFMINGVLYQEQWEAIDRFLESYKVHKMNIDSTGSGDATGDYYLQKYNGWNYDTLKKFERLNTRGTVRPVKFTQQSKHIMYVNWEIAIKEGRIIIPGNVDMMTDPERACFQRFKMEMLNALREWKGSLLNVRHPDSSKGESGDVETDDSVDSCALVFYDPESDPQGFEFEMM